MTTIDEARKAVAGDLERYVTDHGDVVTSAANVRTLLAHTADYDALKGRLEEAEKALRPFANAIFNDNSEVTYDHTMLITCSRDGHAKLLHPKTLAPIRVFEFVKPCRAASISPLFDNTEM